MTFLLLILLGIFTYYTLQRTVAKVTKTPPWLLWLVLMAPPLIWTGWMRIYETQLPSALVFWSLAICFLLYWILFEWGRKDLKDGNNESPALKTESAIHPTVEPAPVRPIEPTEESQLRSCFPWSVYYIQNIEYRPQAVICRGQLKTSATNAYQQVKENIEAEFGDRFILIFQEGLNDKPIFLLVPNHQQKKAGLKQEQITRPGLALLLLVATLLTTTFVGTRIAGIETTAISSNPSLILQGLPYALSLMTILGIHEMGHYLTARFYKIRTTLPYFIPMPFFLGTFGAFIQMRSPVPNRKALFDVSIAGPVAGFIASLPLFIWGLSNSQIVPIDNEAPMLNTDALNPRNSILIALLSKLTLGAQLTSNMAIDLHPVAVAGFLGIIVTALNLIPVGQLDGGHIVHAIFGQKTAMIIGQIARLLLLLLSLIQSEYLLWAIYLIFLRLADEPALNDVTELDNKRDIFGLLAIALLILIILPLPQALAGLLNI
ncbi:site-2 protease family protein [Plectonema cf. radiosum LEGE 06105]|uniref:Site-2 protease family protein n=1 Tax=Plectonema cf. radiosum LEGE 06105 TaxID=945769 RepID=A0A8J7FLF8_9CYAN|nr:site-2 protease family protein [Plectonema radiosum]MBE9215666.1 site-2 protease family protein [Plectonema cf. radiosum LEGE 06105]